MIPCHVLSLYINQYNSISVARAIIRHSFKNNTNTAFPYTETTSIMVMTFELYLLASHHGCGGSDP